jgi:hypothetical protein
MNIGHTHVAEFPLSSDGATVIKISSSQRYQNRWKGWLDLIVKLLAVGIDKGRWSRRPTSSQYTHVAKSRLKNVGNRQSAGNIRTRKTSSGASSSRAPSKQQVRPWEKRNASRKLREP